MTEHDYTIVSIHIDPKTRERIGRTADGRLTVYVDQWIREKRPHVRVQEGGEIVSAMHPRSIDMLAPEGEIRERMSEIAREADEARDFRGKLDIATDETVIFQVVGGRYRAYATATGSTSEVSIFEQGLLLGPTQTIPLNVLTAHQVEVAETLAVLVAKAVRSVEERSD